MTGLCRALAATDPGSSLAAACNLAYVRGLVTGLAGNASCRQGEGFLCTPTGCCLGEVVREDLVALDGQWRPRAEGRPSSEWRLHAAVYRSLPGVGAVVHTHSPAATALAVLERGVPPLTPEIEHFLGSVPCVPFAPPGTEAVGDGVVDAVARGARAALLARHGAVAWAADVRRALYLAELLESACALVLATGRPMGGGV